MDKLGDLVLTPAEGRVVDDAAAGTSTDFRKKSDVLANGGSWGPRRSVRAEVLVELLTSKRTGYGQPRPLSVAGARITGRLVLEALTLLRPLVLKDCYIEQTAVLDESRASHLDFSGSRLPSLRARQLETRGDVVLDGITDATELALAGARIGGELCLRAARLAGDDNPAFDGDRLEVRLAMDCSGIEADGELNLVGAHIGGLNMNGARLRNPGGTALNADGLRVDHDLFCTSEGGQRFEIEGALRLPGAHIGGQLDMRGARLVNAGDVVLVADGLRVDQDLFCRSDDAGQRFEADGELRLVGPTSAGS